LSSRLLTAARSKRDAEPRTPLNLSVFSGSSPIQILPQQRLSLFVKGKLPLNIPATVALLIFALISSLV